MLALCAQLRSENHVLRDRMAGLEQQKQSLASRADAARLRLEALMEKLPQ